MGRGKQITEELVIDAQLWLNVSFLIVYWSTPDTGVGWVKRSEPIAIELLGALRFTQPTCIIFTMFLIWLRLLYSMIILGGYQELSNFLCSHVHRYV